MRHCPGVKPILWLSLIIASCASCAAADEAADRVVIQRTIAALNEFPPRAALFTPDASSELGRLPTVQGRVYRIPGPSRDPAAMPRVDRPTVTISHEPWGEAAIGLPGMESLPALEILNPRIVSGAIRFITPHVAVVDGDWTYKDGAVTETTPLLFVMKKEGDGWKIASLRVLAPR